MRKASRGAEAGTVRIVVYGDFSCAYSYVASLLADQLLRSGTVGVDWRAVGRRPGPPAAGRGDGGPPDSAAVSAVLVVGGWLPQPAARPVDVDATVAAYAEAVSDGVQDEMRRRLFAAIWAERRPVCSVTAVRELVADVMCPPEPILPRLASPDLPSALLHDPDVNRIVRRSGGTVTPYGGPLTTTGTRRVQRWEREWLSLACPVPPVVIGPDGAVFRYSGALCYLAAAAAVTGRQRQFISGTTG
jgi:hypothetical protein